MDREYFNSIINTERFDLSRAEINSREFYECVFRFKDKVSHLQMTMADVGNASIHAVIRVVEPIKGDFIHDICSTEPYLRDEAFWCMGIYITDENCEFIEEWLTIIFKSAKYAGEKDYDICSKVEDVEYEYIWPAAEEVAKTCIKLPKFEDKLYVRNCEIMATVANAAWKAALFQDNNVLDVLKKTHDEKIQKICIHRKSLLTSEKILTIDLIDSCISSLEELLDFIPEKSLDIFKSYYIYGVWEILEVIVNMIQIAQNALRDFKEEMKPYLINRRISQIYFSIQYFIRVFNLSDVFINKNLELDFSNHLASTGLILNLTNIILEYSDVMFVDRKIFISRLLELDSIRYNYTIVEIN